METFIKDKELPFCKGCGHTTIAQNTEKALQKIGKKTLDVVLVTDIGCHGIIDKSFATHTVHGLHGRSIALGAGVSAGLNNPDKKVIVFVGDGGSTIGMQHLIDAAHNDFNITVVIHNNMLYGMTGGQPSEFTPQGFKTPTQPEGISKVAYDICQVLAAAGASYVRRISGIGDISDALADAFARPGFSVVEVMEICPSYGVKSNPGMKLSKVICDAGIELNVFADKATNGYRTQVHTERKPLLGDDLLIEQSFTHSMTEPVRIMLCGSAGEGVQSAAEMLANAAISAGLNVTKKGSYPVTVGIGFSAAEVIISPRAIHYTGSVVPDVMLITSQDGLEYGAKRMGRMRPECVVYADASLTVADTEARVEQYPYRQKVSPRSASLMSVFYYLSQSRIFDLEALITTFNQSKLSAKLNVETFLKHD